MNIVNLSALLLTFVAVVPVGAAPITPEAQQGSGEPVAVPSELFAPGQHLDHRPDAGSIVEQQQRYWGWFSRRSEPTVGCRRMGHCAGRADSHWSNRSRR